MRNVGFLAIVLLSAGVFAAVAIGLNTALRSLAKTSVSRLVVVPVQSATLVVEVLLMFWFAIVSSEVVSIGRPVGVLVSVALHAAVMIAVTLRTLDF